MSKKGTPTDAATSAGARAERTAGQASVSEDHFIPIPRRRQVVSYLHTGRSSEVKREDLAAMMGMGERALRRQIQRERQQGNLIISDCHNGYFLPRSVDELSTFVKSMRHRAKEIYSVCRAAETALAEAEGQLAFPGW